MSDLRAREIAPERAPSTRETAREIEFTGERIVPGRTAEHLFREHEERYVFAGRYVKEKDVLDVACGTGVGSAFLHHAGAHSVCGFDIDAQAVAFAKARYGDVSFSRCDATELSLADGSVDVVVSFETIEHLADHQKYIKECRRVLRPGGIFICSTPNTRLYGQRWENEYHVHELSIQEFQTLLASYFGELRLFSQMERIYPVYLLRCFAARILDAIGLKETLLRILGRTPRQGPLREEFATGDFATSPSIVPYRISFMIQPVYMLAVARVTSEEGDR
jgi:2-polyprenyl-3-methyl-5-hydroxy-6-metoxy-1,4-benzoquinol methylase